MKNGGIQNAFPVDPAEAVSEIQGNAKRKRFLRFTMLPVLLLILSGVVAFNVCRRFLQNDGTAYTSGDDKRTCIVVLPFRNKQ
jgi:hypothetical protein